jgi:phage/plasmid-associated DNA primase
MATEATQSLPIQPLTGEQEILKTLQTIVPERECVELRVSKKPKFWMSGYFDKDHLEVMARQAILAETTYQTNGLYFCLNSIDPAVLSRRANRFDSFVAANTLTKDDDIIRWNYLPIDVDPARPTGISSTSEELEASEKKADEIITYLTEQGFPLPLRACSGNGTHLLYKINLPRSPENDLVVKTILYYLDQKFSDEEVGVDIVNSNPSRIFKLYGTWAKKGDNTAERPHRRSKITFVPDPFLTVDESVLTAICHAHPLPKSTGKKKGAGKLKNPKDVTSRHPELLKLVGKLVNSNFSEDAILKAAEATNAEFPDPKPADVLDAEVKKLIEFCKARQEKDSKLPDYIVPIYDDESGEFLRNSLDYSAFSDYLSKTFHVKNFKGYLYIYDAENHVYKENLNEIGTSIRDTCLKYKVSDKIVTLQRELHEHLKNMGNSFEYPFDNADHIVPVLNCALKVSGDKIERLEHSPEILKTVKLPVAYDPSAPTEPVLAVLSQWVDEQDVSLLVQILAQALYQQANRTTLKRNYLLQGETDAGKSTYLDMLQMFCGENQISDVSLQEICSDVRFLASRLESKILNVYDDLKDIPLAGAGKLKKLDGRVTHEIERKGKTPYNGNITCPHVFSCNQPPSYDEDLQYDEAWWNRWEFIPFPFSYAKDAKFKKKTFTPAFMSGLLNLVIEEMKKIDACGQLTINRTSGEVRERWGMLSNPLKMWVNDNFEASTEFNNYSKTKLWNDYSKYCEDNNIPIKKRISTDDNFGRKLPGEGFVTLQVRDPENKKSKIWVWHTKKIWTQGKGKVDVSKIV